MFIAKKPVPPLSVPESVVLLRFACVNAAVKLVLVAPVTVRALLFRAFANVAVRFKGTTWFPTCS